MRTATKKPATATKRTAAKPAAKATRATRATATARKPRAAKAPEVIAPIKTKMTASQLMEHLSAETGLDKRDVKAVVLALDKTIKGSIAKKGIGEFTFPGLFKVVTKHIPARKARKGISPFSGEEVMFKAKPATTRVKVRPLAKLKAAAL